MKEIRTSDATAVVQAVLEWARTPGDHGGNPYFKPMVKAAKRAAENSGYNGWTNYETWAVALWLDNEEGTYLTSREVAKEAFEDADPPEVFAKDDRSWRVGRTAEALKDWLEEMMPDLGATLWADLLGVAFGAVDWYEIAESRLEE